MQKIMLTVAERKRRNKLTPRDFLRIIRRTVVEQFQTSPFGLTRADARKCTDKIMKVIERNHKRARIAGLVKM